MQAFQVVANESLDDVYGVRAVWNNRAITISCHVMSEKELVEGGFEVAGSMRAIFTGLNGPQVNDHLEITDPPRISNISRKWVVRGMVPSDVHLSTGYTLEPVP